MLLVLNLPFAMVLGWILAEKERAEATEDGLQELARQARSRALQAQLHPHALYNVLSGLTELVHEDPDAAEEALIQLTELLRMLTRQAAATELPLAQERNLLKHYLAIEAIRLGPRLTVEWNWPDWADPISLPPLLLQPLVENAIKHGIAPHPEGGILRIGIFRSDRDLIFRIANTGQNMNPGQAEGTGMRNLRERLALLKEYQPSLELRTDAPWTMVELRLNLSMKQA
jgi:LytS/YehU family sensor histidine kinase